MLRFRLTLKSAFVNKAGEAIRDSLIKPGDQLTVQARPDDPETAVRIVLVRQGSGTERSTASSEIDPSIARTPTGSDMSKPRTITLKGGGSATASEEAEPEKESKPATKSESKTESKTEEKAEPAKPRAALIGPPPPPSGLKDPKLESDEKVIADARAAVPGFLASLPVVQAQQVATRYFKSGATEWQRLDRATAVVKFVDRKFEHDDLQIDGNPTPKTPPQLGLANQEDFQRALESLLSPRANVTFKRAKAVVVNFRPALLYEFQVDEATSQWAITSADSRRYNASFSGTVTIDQETHKPLRLEQATAGMPGDFPIAKMEQRYEFSFVRIDKVDYLVPLSAETVMCMNGSGTCTRRVSEFNDYRKPE